MLGVGPVAACRNGVRGSEASVALGMQDKEEESRACGGGGGGGGLEAAGGGGGGKDTTGGGGGAGGRWLWCSAFDEPALERLYQSYSVRQRRDGLQCFVAAAALHSVHALATDAGDAWEPRAAAAACLLVACMLLLTATHFRASTTK